MTSLLADPLDFAQRHRLTIGLLAMLVLALVVAVAAYAAWPRQTAATAPTTTTTATAPGWSRVCVGGVSYLQFATGASVEWTPAGKVKTCSETTKVSNASK